MALCEVCDFFLVGNWKMNGGSVLLDELREFLDSSSVTSAGPTTVICPPHTLLGSVSSLTSGTSVLTGGQDCHVESSGAFTGDVSAEMIRDIGGKFCLVGHSERRTHHSETNSLVCAKASACLRANLTPIICVGESESDYESGLTTSVLEGQLADSLPPSSDNPPNILVAYEPVWAIGTGKVASTEIVSDVHNFIRDFLATRYGTDSPVPILYGGSVKGDNTPDLSSIPNVNGLLVGGASLKSSDFLAIHSSISP